LVYRFAPCTMPRMPKKAPPAKADKTVRVPVILTLDQHRRFLRAAAAVGGMELAPFLRMAAEEKIRRDGLA
jgi:hypothetical protein